MLKGFYNLTSGMLTQGKRLDVISNNMTNITTPGFKSDQFLSQTFGDVLWSRVGSRGRQYAQIGRQSYITAPSKLYTDFTQGGFDETEMPLDFAIEGDGFFGVQTDHGIEYTRDGSFSLDDEGYLCLAGQGRVLDPTGKEIMLNTDKITADNYGGIYGKDGGFLGKIGVYAFEDNSKLIKNAHGLFTSNTGPHAADAKIHNGYTEHANIDLVQQMTSMMAAQRAYQSAAQLTTMYDALMTKATTEIGRL